MDKAKQVIRTSKVISAFQKEPDYKEYCGRYAKYDHMLVSVGFKLQSVDDNGFALFAIWAQVQPLHSTMQPSFHQDFGIYAYDVKRNELVKL